MDSKSCVICGSDETEGELLVAAPCHDHWVCPDDVSSFFERATENESLFPPKCCGQMFMLQEYEDYVPFEIAWAYQVKEQGEYAVLAKYVHHSSTSAFINESALVLTILNRFRVYCGNPTCAKFLHPTAHITDAESTITYAICEEEKCAKLTCTSCKTLIEHGTQNHTCAKDENEEKFKQIVTEKGYQECSVCGATVELAEACNHITYAFSSYHLPNSIHVSQVLINTWVGADAATTSATSAAMTGPDSTAARTTAPPPTIQTDTTRTDITATRV
jgi:hypothetical protein